MRNPRSPGSVGADTANAARPVSRTVAAGPARRRARQARFDADAAKSATLRSELQAQVTTQTAKCDGWPPDQELEDARAGAARQLAARTRSSPSCSQAECLDDRRGRAADERRTNHGATCWLDISRTEKRAAPPRRPRAAERDDARGAFLAPHSELPRRARTPSPRASLAKRCADRDGYRRTSDFLAAVHHTAPCFTPPPFSPMKSTRPALPQNRGPGYRHATINPRLSALGKTARSHPATAIVLRRIAMAPARREDL